MSQQSRRSRRSTTASSQHKTASPSKVLPVPLSPVFKPKKTPHDAAPREDTFTTRDDPSSSFCNDNSQQRLPLTLSIDMILESMFHAPNHVISVKTLKKKYHCDDKTAREAFTMLCDEDVLEKCGGKGASYQLTETHNAAVEATILDLYSKRKRAISKRAIGQQLKVTDTVAACVLLKLQLLELVETGAVNFLGFKVIYSDSSMAYSTQIIRKLKAAAKVAATPVVQEEAETQLTTPMNHRHARAYSQNEAAWTNRSIPMSQDSIAMHGTGNASMKRKQCVEAGSPVFQTKRKKTKRLPKFSK